MERDILDDLANVRDELYNTIPTGEVQAFDLIKVIKEHISKLDEIIGYNQKIADDIEKECKAETQTPDSKKES